MKAHALADLLYSLPDEEVYAAGDFDKRIIEAVLLGRRKVVLILDEGEQDEVITLDIIGPSEMGKWQIVYSTGAIRHKPIGRELSDFLVAESIVNMIYRNIADFATALSFDSADAIVDQLAEYGDTE